MWLSICREHSGALDAARRVEGALVKHGLKVATPVTGENPYPALGYDTPSWGHFSPLEDE